MYTGEYNAGSKRQKRVHDVCGDADRRRRAVFDWPVIIALSPQPNTALQQRGEMWVPVAMLRQKRVGIRHAVDLIIHARIDRQADRLGLVGGAFHVHTALILSR